MLLYHTRGIADPQTKLDRATDLIRFLAAAEPLPPALRGLAQGDRIRLQQYLDFLNCRRFRQTLLCHRGTALQDPPNPERVRSLWASSPAARVSEEEFRGPSGVSLRTNLPAAQAAMLHLGRCWPRAVAFDELVIEAGPSAAILADLLLRACASGLVELHAAPSFMPDLGLNSEVAPWGKLQLAQGTGQHRGGVSFSLPRHPAPPKYSLFRLTRRLVERWRLNRAPLRNSGSELLLHATNLILHRLRPVRPRPEPQAR
jgi:hypothetical protein